jgi:hypothetical protein
VLVLLAAKLTAELVTGHSVLGELSTAGCVLSPVSHAAGALVAVVLSAARTRRAQPAPVPARRAPGRPRASAPHRA